MIWLLPNPLLPLPSVPPATYRKTEKESKRDSLMTGGGGEGVGEEPNQ
jgi:hypothetical protein